MKLPTLRGPTLTAPNFFAASAIGCAAPLSHRDCFASPLNSDVTAGLSCDDDAVNGERA